MVKKIAQNPGASANVGTQAPGTSATKTTPAAKPTPKSPRRNRDRAEKQEAKAATASGSTPIAQTLTSDTPAPPVTTAAAASSTPPPSAPTGAAPPARRTRPMLGLASRHFEAALSGAGVERKARREGKEKEPLSTSGTTSAEPKPAPPAVLTREAAVQGLAILARPAAAAQMQEVSGAGTGAREEGSGAARGGGGGRGRGRGGRGRGGSARGG